MRVRTARERNVAWLGVLLLAVTAVAVLSMSVLVYRSASATERADAELVPVKATVVSRFPDPSTAASQPAEIVLHVTYPFGGTTRDGTVVAFSAAPVGSQIDAWMRPDGRLDRRPQERLQTIAQTVLTALGGLILLVGLRAAGKALMTAWSTRLRYAEWDAEWAQFDAGREPPR